MIDRIEAALRAIVLGIFEEKLYGAYPYVVDSFDEAAQSVTASPASSGGKLPNVAGVKIRTAHMQLKLKRGDGVVVMFENGDKAAPFVANYDYAAVYGSALPSARQGDMTATSLMLVQAVVPPAGPIPNTYWIVVPPVPATVPVPFVPGVGGMKAFYGQVSSGSVWSKTR